VLWNYFGLERDAELPHRTIVTSSLSFINPEEINDIMVLPSNRKLVRMKVVIPHGLSMRKPRVPARGFFFYQVFMNQERVICFVDGFNLYHAIHYLKAPHLKWVNLWSLASVFIRPKSQQLKYAI
jgi:hypothetical protein